MGTLSDFARKARTFIIGGARSVEDPDLFKKLSLAALLAWVGLGSDGLTSACYGPEEAFLALGARIPLGVFVAAATALTIFVIAASYSQIVEVFPSGGGGYLVASKLLTPGLGMASGCALLVDYVLTISLSIAAGADALFSSLPASFQPSKLIVACAGILLLMVLNLRGVRESVMSLTPIFLLFLLTHLVAVIYPLVVHLPELGAHVARTATEVNLGVSGIGTVGVVFLILRAYSMGAGTFTGIEAVSNAMPILREPRVATAKKTMRYMALSLALLAAGLMVGYILYDVRSEPGRTLNATLFNRIIDGWGPAGTGVRDRGAAFRGGVPLRRGPDRVSQRAAGPLLHVHGPLVPAAVQPPQRAVRDQERACPHGDRGPGDAPPHRRLGAVHGRAVQHQRVHHLHAVPAGHGAALDPRPAPERRAGARRSR